MRAMIRALPALLLMLFVSSATGRVLQAQAFEGTLTFRARGDDGDKTITEWVKGASIRYDYAGAPGREGTMIIDGTAKTRTVVMPARRMYMTVPYDPAARKPPVGEKPQVTWTRTGKTETVAGVRCEVIHGSGVENGKPKEADLCVAKGIGFGGSTGAGPFGEALAEFANLDLKPGEGIVKVTSLDAGKSEVELELTKVDRRSLAAVEFEPPAGYTRVERPAPAGGPPPVEQKKQ
jgi:hypothetical protein